MFGIETFIQTQSSYFTRNISHVNLAVGVVVLSAALFSFLRQSKTKLSFDSVQMMTLALYGFGFLSYFWTLSPEIFAQRWGGSVPYLIVFAVLAPFITQEKNVLEDGFFWALVFGIPVVFLDAFYCEWGDRGMILAEPIRIGDRIEKETLPLALASMASSIGIIALAFNMRSSYALPLRFVVLVVVIYVVFLTQSRGQVISLIAVSTIVYALINKATHIKGLLVTCIGVVLISAIVFYVLQDVDLWRWDSNSVSRAVEERQTLWISILDKWWSSTPLTMLIGFGANSSYDLTGGYPHNLLVEILTELGLVGFSIYIAILFRCVSNSANLLSKLDSYPKLRSNIITLIGLLCVNFALSLKEGSLDGWHTFFFFAICLNQQVGLTDIRFRETWLNGFFGRLRTAATRATPREYSARSAHKRFPNPPGSNSEMRSGPHTRHP